MPLTTRAKRHLRGLAHHLAPVVRVGGAGVTEGVVKATDTALSIHELIKVRVDDDRDGVREAASSLSEQTKADIAQIIGKVVVLYRPAKDPDRRHITLPG